MTNVQHELKAEKRTLLGKKSKRVRAQGNVPANIFGKVDSSLAISVSAKEFQKIYAEAGETGVVYLFVGDEKKNRPTLIDEVEMDPLTRKVLHVSFRQVDLNEKVSAAVPIETVGELAVQEATIQLMHEEVEVEALPTDFPESFTIDLSQFTEIGQEFFVKQLDYDRTKLELSLEQDELLLQVQEVQQMAEEPVEETPAAEGAEGEAAPAAEGEKPAEGEAKPAEEEKKE